MGGLRRVHRGIGGRLPLDGRSAFQRAEIIYELGGEYGIWLKTTPRGAVLIFR